MQSTQPADLIPHVFNTLSAHFGEFDWWPSTNPYEIMLGAILVQNTNWNNAEKALRNLPQPLAPDVIAAIPTEELAPLIRSSGYYNQKAMKLHAVTQWYANYDYDIEKVRQKHKPELRKELLAIKGVGGETADVILTYAIGFPSFVVDTYARRIFERNGLDVPKAYEKFHQLCEQHLWRQKEKYGYFHGLMVEHGQMFCQPTPKCDACPLRKTCHFPS